MFSVMNDAELAAQLAEIAGKLLPATSICPTY